MGTFRYYTHTGPMPGPIGLAARFIAIGTLSYLCLKWDFYEVEQEQGAMKNNTFLYFKHHTNIANHDPNRPTFPRIRID